MQINYYFRNTSSTNFSIENVFCTIINALQKACTISVYYTRSPIDFVSIFKVRNLKADVHHITGAVNYLAFGLPGKRTIITVHDIGHYTETLTGWRKVIYKYFFLVLPLRKVTAVTTISDFTKEQLIKEFNIAPTKITVIPNPVNPAFTFIAQRMNALPVILQIGAGYNKNIDKLLEAVKGLKVKLLLIRKPDNELMRKLKDNNIFFEFRSNLSEHELIQAYADSDIVYFASTYEGFGLPIIEAMALGRPVITSRISPMKEIGEDAAVIVDPLNISEIRSSIVSLIESKELYHQLVERGSVVVKKYRSEGVAMQYKLLYESLLRDVAHA